MIGIFLGLALLIFLAYKGYNIIWVAPLCALVVAVTGGLNLFEAYTVTYMEGLVGFAKSWFPVFLFGAVYGKLMEVTGQANAVAEKLAKLIGSKRAILAVIITCAVLTYGGVSLFVAVFAVYPMAVAMFKEANVPKRLLPGAIACGCFTFTMTALPGSPQLNNLIAAQYLGTDPMAAPILGIVSSVIMFGGGYAWLVYREKKFTAAGEGFGEDEAFDQVERPKANWILGIISLVIVVVTLNVLKWEALLALGAGIIFIVISNPMQIGKQMKYFIESLNEGGQGAVLAIMNTAAAVGFGSIVKAVPGFAKLTDIMLGIGGGSGFGALGAEAVAITTLAGATGSSSGGMTIALEALGEYYLQVAASTGISPEVFHRVATVASGGLDSLPHCGAVITLLAVCKLNYKKSYADVGMITCVIPIIAVVAIVILGAFGVV